MLRGWIFGQALLRSVAALEPVVRGTAAAAEGARCFPSELIDSLAAIGLFRALVPCSVGGLELEPLGLLEVVEEVSRWDGSAGWLAMIGSGASFVRRLSAARPPPRSRKLLLICGTVWVRW